MHVMRTLVAILLGLTVLIAATAAPAKAVPVAVPDASTGVVVSIAISAGVLQPGQFPVAGRDCDTVLSELRTNERFAGRISKTYEPPADTGHCFNLEGKRAQVAVVCCAPGQNP